MVVTRRAAAASSSTVAPTAPSPVRRWQWHFFDNNGSFDGWFDWVPLRLRVGYFSPIAVCLLIGLELSILCTGQEWGWLYLLPLSFTHEAMRLTLQSVLGASSSSSAARSVACSPAS